MVSESVKAKRKLKRKKERISKHILASRERKKEEEEQNNPSSSSQNENSSETTTKKKQKQQPKKQQHVKDPREAHSYLITWKQQQTNKEDSGWKFNKNCQSWLIRHMYEPEKVLKTTFGILMEYFVDLKGNTRDRVIADATRRALRYKNWEKAKSDSTNIDDNNNKNSSKEKKETEDDNNDTATNKDEEKEEQQKWSALDDNNKRKEYKRARKVLETLR